MCGVSYSSKTIFQWKIPQKQKEPHVKIIIIIIMWFAMTFFSTTQLYPKTKFCSWRLSWKCYMISCFSSYSLPLFYSFKSPLNHMINFQTKTGWCERNKSNWNTIMPLRLWAFLMHLSVIWILDMVFYLYFFFFSIYVLNPYLNWVVILFLPFWTWHYKLTVILLK